MKTEREKFEKWIRRETAFDLELEADGEYVFGGAHDHWVSWQARAALSTLVPEEPSEAWILSSDRLPETGVSVIAYFANSLGNGRRIRAAYCAAKSLKADYDNDLGEYDEENDMYWCPEGWYETNEHEETHWQVDDVVTHWQPLPAWPIAAIPKD